MNRDLGSKVVGAGNPAAEERKPVNVVQKKTGREPVELRKQPAARKMPQNSRECRPDLPSFGNDPQAEKSKSL